MTSYRDGAVAGECKPCDACVSGADAVTKMSMSLLAGQQALNAAKQAITQLSALLQAGKEALRDAEQAMKQITIPLPNVALMLILADVAVAMEYQPVDMSMVPDHIKEFCANRGFFLLEGTHPFNIHTNFAHNSIYYSPEQKGAFTCSQAPRGLTCAFEENDIATVPNAPSNPAS
ncbi:hypothetical protein DXG01_002197 [Tephrocybe rancida]|nr:hypothetical protein DXG01_002197 [Tephrocybe rancida]